LYTTPRQTCLGLWLALDPATLENGCLWARPGSHREPVRRKFVRNPARFKEGDKTAPQMIFETENPSCEAWKWEGKMPSGFEPPESRGLRETGFVSVECSVGDLVVVHGQVDHLSLTNTSSMQRETFQLHLIEGPGQGVTWSELNWLQYPMGKHFPSLRKKACAGEKRKADAL
jgi:phytanoyl-CoA hydroxylase